MCIYIHKKARRRVVVAAHSHRGGRSPPGRWSWKVKDKNNQFLEVSIFSLSLPRFLPSPRIQAYIEHTGSPWRETGWGHTALIEPWEGKRPSEQHRRGRLAASRGRGAERRQRRGSAEKTAPSSKGRKTEARRCGSRAHGERNREDPSSTPNTPKSSYREQLNPPNKKWKVETG